MSRLSATLSAETTLSGVLSIGKGEQGVQGTKDSELIDARCGATSLGEFNRGIISSLKHITTQIDEIKYNNGFINQNGNNSMKIWAGTQLEYDNLLVKDEDTVYLIEGEGSVTPSTTYTITNNLIGCTSSNSNTSINENSSYNATITANDGYKLSSTTITMGGTDITSSSYSNGSILIQSVTGNIVITIKAILIDYNLLDFSQGTTEYKYLNATGALTTDQVGTFMDISLVDYIPVNRNDVVKMNIPNYGTRKYTICEYSSTKTFILRTKDTATGDFTVTISNTNTKFIRIGCAGVDAFYTQSKMNNTFNNLTITINDNKVTLPVLT